MKIVGVVIMGGGGSIRLGPDVWNGWVLVRTIDMMFHSFSVAETGGLQLHWPSFISRQNRCGETPKPSPNLLPFGGSMLVIHSVSPVCQPLSTLECMPKRRFGATFPKIKPLRICELACPGLLLLDFRPAIPCSMYLWSLSVVLDVI